MKTPHKKEWFDDDSFWRELYPFMFPQQRLTDAQAQSGKVLALTKPPGKSVLDLCCGPGRFSLAFAKKGFAVTGVDKTKYLLDKARAKARAAQVRIEWVQSDMRDFVRPDSFGLVVSTFTSFGYFDDKREDMLVLDHMLASLQPGGACLVEVMGKEILARVLKSPITTILPDGAIWIDRHEIVEDWTRVRNEWLVIRNGKTKSFNFKLTVYSGQELRERMERAGFVDVTLYGNLDGAEYGSNAERLIAVGRKAPLESTAGGASLTRLHATAKTKRK
jgi:SAM-dependent methyltransferase